MRNNKSDEPSEPQIVVAPEDEMTVKQAPEIPGQDKTTGKQEELLDEAFEQMQQGNHKRGRKILKTYMQKYPGNDYFERQQNNF